MFLGWLVLYPFFCLWFIFKNKERLEDETFNRKFKYLYHEISTRGLYCNKINYYFVFLFRRLIFVAIPTFLFMFGFLQLQLLLFTTSLYIIYYSGSRPHNTSKRVSLESFNEFMVMVASYHMICYSEFNLDVDSQYIMGYSHIGVIGIVVVVNVGNMVYE